MSSKFEITFKAKMIVPATVGGLGFAEAVQRVAQALLDGDGGEVDYRLELDQVRKLKIVEEER